MKKLLVLIIALIACVAVFTSCNFGGETPDNGGGDKTDDTADGILGDDPITSTDKSDGDLIWSSKVDLFVVDDEGGKEINTLRQHLYAIVGVAPEVNASDTTSASHEIVFGDVGRKISDTAYNKLDRFADLYDLEQNGESAYLIYAEGGSLAIAYSDVIARNAAVDYIANTILASEFYAKGTVKQAKFNTEQFLADVRNEEREEGFAELKEFFDEDAIDALRDFYNLYDEDLYLLIASLYEPEATDLQGNILGGGFYYSTSARDSEGFLPDLESTGQSLAILDNSGLSTHYGTQYILDDFRSWHNMLSDEMKEDLLNFALNLQDTDRYFYHPQWGSAISTSRRGRDAGWAKRIITILGGEPKYGYINSDVNLTSHSSSTSTVTSLRLDTSTDAAVSKVVPVVAAELSSWEAWLEVLKTIPNDSYSRFNNINSRITEIKNAGLWDETMEYIIETQKPNGTWEDEVSYNAINGLMKVSTFFNSTYKMRYPEAAIQSTLDIMERDNIDEIIGITFIYNPWVVLSNLLNDCEDETEAELRQYLRDNAATYIRSTQSKLAVFQRSDGGFSYNQTCSAHYSQGALVAVEGSEESDVNATSIAISTLYSYMMKVLLYGTDYEAPALYSRYDSLYFLEAIEKLEPVVKKPYDGPEPWLEDFEEYDSSEGAEANGIVKYPASFIETNLGIEEVDNQGKYKFYNCSITDDPAGVSGNVLFMQSKVYDLDSDGKINDNGVECAPSGSGSNSQFNIINVTELGNAYVFEADLYFDGSVANGTVMQLMFTDGSYDPKNSIWINFIAADDGNGGQYLTMQENFAGRDGEKNTNLVGSILDKTWFNLRIEMYKVYDEEGVLSVLGKIFIDGVYRATTDSSNFNSSKGTYEDYIVKCVRLSCFRTAGTSLYLDNIYVAKEKMDYVEETVFDHEIDTTVSAPTIYDFETEVTGGIYSKLASTEKDEDGRTIEDQTSVLIDATRPLDYGLFFNIVSDPDNSENKALMLDSNHAGSLGAGYIYIDTPKVADNYVHILEFDYRFVKNSKATAVNIIQLDLLDINGMKMGGSSSVIANRLTSAADGAAKVGTSTNAYRINSNQWYKIRIVIDPETNSLQYHIYNDSEAKWYLTDAPKSISAVSTIASLRLVCNAYNNTGSQYIDNINYYMSDSIPEVASVTNPYENIVLHSSKVVYDFETDAYLNNSLYFSAYTTLKADEESDSQRYTFPSKEYDSAVAEIGKDGSANLIKGYGAAFYLLDDPAKASGKVLQIVSRDMSGGSAYADFLASKTSDTVTTLELTFDYYTDYNSYIQQNLPIMRVMLWGGPYEPDDVAADRRVSIMSYPSGGTGNKYSFNADAKNEFEQTTKLTNSFKIGDKILDSHTWYTVKLIINGGKQYVYVAPRGGSFELISTSDYSADVATLKYARFYLSTYHNTTRQYLDNISCVLTDSFVDPTK